MARITKKRASGARASSWDKISARGLGETLANRDVHEDQQLDRGTIAGKKTKTPRMIATVLIGLVVFVVAWIACSMITMAVTSLSSGLTGLGSPSGHSYYQRDTRSGPNGVPRTCYRPVSSANNPIGTRCYARVSQVPVPRWYRAQQHRRARETKAGKPGRHDDRPANTLASNLGSVSPLKLIVSLTPAALIMLLLGSWLSKRVDSANLMHDTSDVNQYPDDQHIALPEEIQRMFDWFPDAGAHSSVQANSMISHMMLTNKKLKKVDVTKRAETDIRDADGDLEYYRGEAIVDENGDPVTTMQPMIDEEFSEALFDASGLPKDKSLRKKYDTTVIPYNPGDASRDKLTGYATVADLINGDWTFPGYEVQRPGGAYIVDTAPVNTMVLAITRAGKGQTYIEPMIDMWLREKNPSNMVINDPKGELLVKNYIAAVTRGFEVVQFNLINPMKTDIYNLLGMAAEAAREGDATKCAMYVDNIANVFFPVDGGEDPVWPNAAQNAFKQVAYGLIDHYLEEERELRDTAAATGMDPEVLDTRLNDMWGKVTLYNCYQFFVQLTAKKLKNPVEELGARVKAGEFGDPDGEGFQREAFEAEKARAERRAFLWEDKPDADMLTLYFNATGALPRNTVRTLVGNANNALRAMAGAEKMLASVYGIAITAMSFFTDPTISTLTSGTPNQNVDLAGLSFPRRLGVRFAQNYLNRDHLVGLQCVWSAYGDAMFTDDLGEDFGHTDIIGREGWARYNFKGIFPADEAWLKLELRNPATNMLVRTFYFQFKKGYQTSLNGRHYVTETVTGRKIVKNGVLRELRPVTDAGGQIVSYKPRDTLFPAAKLVNLSSGVPEKAKTEARAITQTLVRYSESPKAVFLVTPPHLMSYAKLILILVKQLVDVSFDQSYMTKSNQKPLYRTRFMLDELGNLQSDGHGISGFETMLSIGLGQEQQFTLILQTLQQLRDVYGESVDKIVQGNAQPMNALIATPDGWTKMGDIAVGDEVLTPFGTVTTVTGVYPKGLRPVYRVTLRDGSTTEVCNEHLWAIERWKSSFCTKGGDRVGTNFGKTCERVIEVIDTDDMKHRLGKGRSIDLPRIKPVSYIEADLPVDPYVLGAILGDAHVQPNGVVKLACNEVEIVEEIRRRGYVVPEDTVHGQPRTGCRGYRINGVNAHMRALGLAGTRSWEKSIPQTYLRGSVHQRIDLLRGLMDTDGTVSATGEMEFASVSRELAGNVQELVRSLGGRVAVNVKAGITYTSATQPEPAAGRDAYRVQNIRLPEINPFLLRRKAERWRDRTGSFGNRVVSVEHVRDDLVQCIAVADERHLYLTDDFIPTHNTSNIVFLKSTDDEMIETLEKMSGKTHQTYADSKSVTVDKEKLGQQVSGQVSYTFKTDERAVISYNNMAFIPERNSIVFRAGDAPVWNRNATILPMSFKLLGGNTIVHPGHEYDLQTLPTLSSALDFDVRRNQPDFVKMLDKRMRQAVCAQDAKDLYKGAYQYADFDVAQLDPDTYADEVMEIISVMSTGEAARDPNAPQVLDADDDQAPMMFDDQAFVENVEVQKEIQDLAAQKAMLEKQIYAEGLISRSMLLLMDGTTVNPSALHKEIVEAYKRCRTDLERDGRHFSVGGDGELRSADGTTTYITTVHSKSFQESVAWLNQAATEENARVFGEGELSEDGLSDIATVKVHADFYRFLVSLPTWEHLADGEFDRAMAVEMRNNS